MIPRLLTPFMGLLAAVLTFMNIYIWFVEESYVIPTQYAAGASTQQRPLVDTSDTTGTTGTSNPRHVVVTTTSQQENITGTPSLLDLQNSKDVSSRPSTESHTEGTMPLSTQDSAGTSVSYPNKTEVSGTPMSVSIEDTFSVLTTSASHGKHTTEEPTTASTQNNNVSLFYTRAETSERSTEIFTGGFSSSETTEEPLIPTTELSPDTSPTSTVDQQVSQKDASAISDYDSTTSGGTVMSSEYFTGQDTSEPTTEQFLDALVENVSLTSESSEQSTKDIAVNNTEAVTENPSVTITEEDYLILSPQDKNGSTILKKKISKRDVEALKRWNPDEEVLSVIHIGDTGGSSYDLALQVGKWNRCEVSCVQNVVGLTFKPTSQCYSIKPANCTKHFSWTPEIPDATETRETHKVPIILFSNPVLRSVGHFYFTKNTHDSAGQKMQNQSLTEYLADTESMLQTRQIGSDGVVRYTFMICHSINCFSTMHVSCSILAKSPVKNHSSFGRVAVLILLGQNTHMMSKRCCQGKRNTEENSWLSTGLTC